MTLFEQLGIASADVFIKQAGFNVNSLKTLGTKAVGFLQNPNIQQPITTGLNAIKTTANNVNRAVTPAREFVSNTFKPGTASLKKRLDSTGRLYNTPQAANMTVNRNAPENITKRMTTAKNERLKTSPNTAGYYAEGRNVAVSNYPINSEFGKKVMRHELAHGVQSNSATLAAKDRNLAEAYQEMGIPYSLDKHLNTYENSLQGLVGRLGQSNTPYRKALGKFLGEVNSNASEQRSVLGQIYNGARFAMSPRQAKFYSNYYKDTPFGKAYRNIHYGTMYGGLGLGAAAGTAGVMAAGPANSAMPNNDSQPEQTEGR
jgi:hypothetical protein